jgi:hypothetical protein
MVGGRCDGAIGAHWQTGPLSNFLPGAEEAGWVPKITLGASKGLLAGVKSG